MYLRLLNLPIGERDSLFLLGPRGTGKTAWLNHHVPESIYLDLLDFTVYSQLLASPSRLKEKIPDHYQGWVILDEIQRIPELLNEVHRLIENQKIRFILTGSSARKLKRHGVNLLAGRALRYSMHPLVPQELNQDFKLKQSLEFGLLPAVYTYADPVRYLSTYIQTYLQEEIVQEGLTRNLTTFTRFLEVASFSQGATINATEIAREVGIDRQMIQNYFSILEELLIAHRIPAFIKRAKRRLIQKDRFYYFDAGVYRYLRPKGILDQPSEVEGAGLETCFMQIFLALNDYYRWNMRLYYWRTSNGLEVDFIVYGEMGLWAFEIKHTQHITPRMLHGLKEFQSDYPMAQCYLLYLGKETLYLENHITVYPMEWALINLPKILVPDSLGVK
ncbi:MAG: ATPase [Verrucomicrobia bacterium RIFCSPHIGHO2_12_FULL_41_10]|nr:MAG: ATPase [Verrucomicrobia bacterium RIFCSPHIGHO2_12_FULL_41_10]